MVTRGITAFAAMLLLCGVVMAQEKNLVENPSFEDSNTKDPKAPLFPHWISKVWDGQCDLRVSPIAHSGKQSAVFIAQAATKIRLWQEREMEPGRYRTTAYLRGFDIGLGIWKSTTEFMFDEKYINLEKNGTFGWTKLTYVGDVKDKKKVMGPSIGMFAPGYLWIDDVTLEKVDNDVALTPKPVFEKEEAPLAPPGKLDGTAIHCPECKARNMAAWKNCYVCGTDLSLKKATAAGPERTGPAVKVLADFQDKNPICTGDSGKPAPVVDVPGSKGVKASRLDKAYDVWPGNQDWTGYDYLRMDVYTEAKKGLTVNFEFYDIATHDYWTRGMYLTAVPPGLSTITIHLKLNFDTNAD